MGQRLQALSQACVDTHTSQDIWEHLEEELAELLLAIKRVRRRREPVINVIEELIDVDIEINTVLTMIKRPDLVEQMLTKKLDKFEAMLTREKVENFHGNIQLKMIDRYHPIEQLYPI
jgi:hypothetical protein